MILQSSVSAAQTIKPSALTFIHATFLMLISECVYSMSVTACPLPFTHFSTSLNSCVSCSVSQVLGVFGQCARGDLQKGSSAERHVPVWSVPAKHPVRLPEGGQLPLRPLLHRAENLEGAAAHRSSASDTCSVKSRIKSIYISDELKMSNLCKALI